MAFERDLVSYLGHWRVKCLVPIFLCDTVDTFLLNVDTSMLLGPKFSRQLSADDDWKTKRSLFSYIHATGKEL